MRARHYIRQYGCLGVKTEQVADYVGVSRTALEEHFRRELKQTVHQALLQHKLEHAGELLTSSSLPLADIAVRCGFTSLQYMYAVFRREYNLTPKQFQAQQRGADLTESTDSAT
jgi:LacI family transcriptional regulator